MERPQQEVLHDITAVFDILVLAGFCTAFSCLRRNELSLSTFAHALSMIFLIISVGHMVEYHFLTPEKLRDIILYPSRDPILIIGCIAMCVASFAMLLPSLVISPPYCIERNRGKNGPYEQSRIKVLGQVPLFSASAVIIWTCISLRLNAILGGSTLYPNQGGYLWQILECPEVITCIIVSSSFNVWMYVTFQTVDNSKRTFKSSPKSSFLCGNVRYKADQSKDHVEKCNYGRDYLSDSTNKSKSSDSKFSDNQSRKNGERKRNLQVPEKNMSSYRNKFNCSRTSRSGSTSVGNTVYSTSLSKRRLKSLPKRQIGGLVDSMQEYPFSEPKWSVTSNSSSSSASGISNGYEDVDVIESCRYAATDSSIYYDSDDSLNTSSNRSSITCNHKTRMGQIRKIRNLQASRSSHFGNQLDEQSLNLV